jgi:hypothetical protein
MTKIKEKTCGKYKVGIIIILMISSGLIIWAFINFVSKLPPQPERYFEICLEKECYNVKNYKTSSVQDCVSFINNQQQWIAFCGNIKIKEKLK